MEDDKLYCPHCGSSQLVANKKGFGAGKALTGAILTGGVGLLAGFIGSGNVKVTCLKCGKQWAPGALKTTPTPEPQQMTEQNTADNEITTVGCVVFAIIIIVLILGAIIS